MESMLDKAPARASLRVVPTPAIHSLRNRPDATQQVLDSAVIAIYCPPEAENKVKNTCERHSLNALINPPSLRIFKGHTVCHYQSGNLEKAYRSLLIEAVEYGCIVEPLIDHIERTRQITEIDLLHDHYFLHQKAFSILSNRLSFNSKRVFDIIVSTIAIPLLSPVFLLVALLIKIDSPGPVFFKQSRTGQYNKEFSVIKFRSMSTDAEKDGAQWASTNDPRITRAGRLLRASRIDELPQLFNVLKGEMSLIGPRPEREHFISELEKQIPYYRFRHAVKPGITGLAQVLYPYGASIEDAKWKHRFDLFYIRNQTAWLDIRIMARTFLVVAGLKGR